MRQKVGKKKEKKRSRRINVETTRVAKPQGAEVRYGAVWPRRVLVGGKERGCKKVRFRGSSPLEGGKGRVGVAVLLQPPRGGLVDGGMELPVPIRGQWIRDQRYADLRNAAWFVRNYRMVAHEDTLAVAKLCYAVRCLLDAGEPLEAVVPSLVDLFVRP